METIEYKDGLYRALWNKQIPDRVPVSQNVDLVYALQYAGMSLTREQYNLDKCFEAVDKVCEVCDGDNYPISSSKNVVALRIMGSRDWVMGKDGFLQHPNHASMREDEYDFMLSDFKGFSAEMSRRSNAAYDCSPEEAALAKLRVDVSNERYNRKNAEKKAWINEKHQRSTYEKTIGMSGGPFDTIANNYRSFTGALNDMRRYPETVLKAVRMLTDNALKRIDMIPAGVEGGRIFMPLHMATFMKEKDFQKFWWPFYKEVLDKCAATDRRIWIFFEDRWDRYMDYLQQIPPGAEMQFEFTDAALAKEKLGKDQIICGFYPITLMKSATEEECCDEAKKLLDLCAPGGNFIFKTDKNPILLADAKPENMQAVIRTVKEYGKY